MPRCCFMSCINHRNGGIPKQTFRFNYLYACTNPGLHFIVQNITFFQDCTTRFKIIVLVAHRYRFPHLKWKDTGSILGGGTKDLLLWFGSFLLKSFNRPHWKCLCALIREKKIKTSSLLFKLYKNKNLW